MSRSRASLGLVLILAVGCASFESTAYKSIGAVAVSVEQARRAYVALYDAGKITPATKAKVEKAYADYQKAMALADVAITAYKADKNQPLLQQAVDAVSAAAVAFIGLAQAVP